MIKVPAVRQNPRAPSLAMLTALILSMCGCVVEPGTRDIISVGVATAKSWINALPLPFYLLPLRFAVIFVLIGAATGLSFAHGSRSESRQIALATTALIAGASVPIPAATNPAARSILFLFSLTVCFIGPRLIPFWITPIAGFQRITMRVSFLLMAIAAVLTFFL